MVGGVVSRLPQKAKNRWSRLPTAHCPHRQSSLANPMSINKTFLSLATIVVFSLFSFSCSCKRDDYTVGNNKTQNEGFKKSDSTKREQVVEITDTMNLRIYSPKYSKIDFKTGEMPSKNDTTVIFVAEGAFSAGKPEEFAQGTVAGDHVSGGIRMKGYTCKRNNGAFIYYNGLYKFLHEDYSNELDTAAKNGGCGFTQEMMIHNGQIVSHTRPNDNVNKFRALCLIKGRLAITDSKSKVKFGNFINDLQKAGATEALYLDMGPGWNYSWFRDDYGNPVNIHPESTIGTNWIVFYK